MSTSKYGQNYGYVVVCRSHLFQLSLLRWLLNFIGLGNSPSKQLPITSRYISMQQGSSILILVVDDEPPVIDLLQRLGQDLFPQAHFVSTDSPQQTLDYLDDTDKQQPQLVLLDIDLHQSLNGIELLPQIRTRLQQQAPIIMFTVSESQPDIEQAYAAGAIAYTKKPEDLEGWKHYINVLKSYWYTTSRLPGYLES